MPFPPTGRKWIVSSGGGAQPRWRRDGRALLLPIDGWDDDERDAGSGDGAADGRAGAPPVDLPKN